MIKIYHNATNALVIGGGGNAPLYLIHESHSKNPHNFYESHAVIARFVIAESKKSAQNANPRPLRHYSSVAKYPLKNFCFVWLLPNEESLSPLDSNPQSKTDFHSMVRNIRLCERVL